MKNYALHSDCDSISYGTPRSIFDPLNDEFSFNLDPCACSERILCPDNYFRDGLTEPWRGRVFMNPPFNEIHKWVEKAYHSAREGATVVCLLPSRTDQAWFHSFILCYAEIRWIRKRVKYVGEKHNAPFASFIGIFNQHSYERLSLSHARSPTHMDPY